jgi:hypothetical protein
LPADHDRGGQADVGEGACAFQCDVTATYKQGLARALREPEKVVAAAQAVNGTETERDSNSLAPIKAASMSDWELKCGPAGFIRMIHPRSIYHSQNVFCRPAQACLSALPLTW